jgi:hypothetical protein
MKRLRVRRIEASRAARNPRQPQTTYDATGKVLYRSHYSPRTNLVVIDLIHPDIQVWPPATHKVFEELFVRLFYRCRDYDE